MAKEFESSGIISDFDNTLVKTQDFIIRHINRTCSKLEITPPEEEKVSQVLQSNPPFESIFDELFGKNAQKVLAAYREDAMETHYEPTMGGVEFVKTLQEKNINIVIVSNRIRKLEERLQQAGYNPDWITTIITPDVPKPNKNAYHTALELLEKDGAERTKIYIIGDNPDDYLACPEDLRNNFFAILSGPVSASEFKKAGLDQKQIVNSPKELLEILSP